jgi:hypothetical protein
MRLLAFDYKGSSRVVEPHTYGRGGKWDEEMISAYQIEGYSRSGDPRGWRTFRIADVANVRIDSRHFVEPRPGYQRDDGAFTQIIAQV